MGWKFFIALRYLSKGRKEKFISIISVISILGVIVGVAALIVVISIMTGFDVEIRDKIIGTYSHVILLKDGGIEAEEDVMNTLNKNAHVIATSPFMDEPAFLKTKRGIAGILLRGLDEKREPLVSNVKRYIEGGTLNLGENNAIVGRELLKTLGLKKGEKITVFSPYNKKKEFIILDTFTSGRYDYDANLVFTSIKAAKELFNKDAASGIGMKVDNEFDVNKIKRELQSTFRYPFVIKTWMDLDKNLMRALAIEKKMMFIILGLIIVVACFNIASSLIMQVIEKTKDIGILRSIGARAGDVRTIFIFLGFFIGLTGVLAGGALGIAIAGNINSIAENLERVTGFELFPSDIYYLSDIPVKIVHSDISVIAIFSLVLTVLASLYPAWKAARLNPVDAMRCE